MSEKTLNRSNSMRRQQEDAREGQKTRHESDSYVELLNVLNTRLLSVECRAEILEYAVKLGPCLAFTKGDESYIKYDCASIEVAPDCLVSE